LIPLYTCHNPNLGFVKACKGSGPRGGPGVTSHAFESVREREGINPHTPKGVPTLGVVPMDFRIFRKPLQRSKPNGLNSSLYHWKALGT